MAKVVLIMGETGTGKSHSIRNLPPAETYIINVLDKDLPFRGWKTKYNRESKNIKVPAKLDRNVWKEMLATLNALALSKPEVKYVIIDDIRHIMEAEFIERATETNWTRFTELGQHMAEIMKAAKAIAIDDLVVFLMFHTDDVYNGSAILTKKAKLVGKFVEEHFNPLELASICLVTNVESEEGKNSKYTFITNKVSKDGIQFPAKSPEGMFDLIIDNDLKFVADKIKEYNNG